MDLESEDISDGVWTDIPSDWAYSSECREMFRKDAAEAGGNVYIISNPSYRAEDYMLFLAAIKELQKEYADKKQRRIDANIHIVRAQDGSTFCFAGTDQIPDDVLSELAETHRSTAIDRLPN